VTAEFGIWGAHGCTVLVSAFCGNELPRFVFCLRCDKELRDRLESIASTPQARATQR
jgi:hypothetical protein